MCNLSRVAHRGEEIHVAYEATGTEESGGGAGPPRREVNRGWYWLLVVPLVATLIPVIYNSETPRLIGIPFFYWYQMAMILVSVICTLLVYRRTLGRR
jgi:hypothetical protein